ncbi:MAG: hypothetical protein ACOCT0_00190 [Halobacteriota archaeon]
MTVFSLALPWRMSTPEEAADYVECGLDYVVEVSEALGYATDDVEPRGDRAVEALAAGETDVDDDVAEAVALVLAGDAAFYRAFVDWFPLKYRVLARPLDWTFNPKLRGLAAAYVGVDRAREIERSIEHTSADEVEVDGRHPMEYVDGVGDRVVLADSVLHADWYREVALALDVDLDRALFDAVVDESPAYFAGVSESLSSEVARAQVALFRDSEWLRRVDRAYGLDSWVVDAAAKAIEDAVEDLERRT